MLDFFRDFVLEAVGMDSNAVAYERKNGANMWICRCDCGRIISADAGNLLSGAVTSCGCMYDEPIQSGKRFGRLTVLRPVDGAGGSAWLCKCDCGNTTFVTSGNLLRGAVSSCGCQAIVNVASQRELGDDLTGRKFGKLTVLRFDDKKQMRGKRKKKETFIFSSSVKVIAFVLGILYLIISGLSILTLKEAGGLTAYHILRFIFLSGCDIGCLICLAIGRKKTEIASLVLMILFAVTQYFTTLFM